MIGKCLSWAVRENENHPQHSLSQKGTQCSSLNQQNSPHPSRLH
nr:MAG TPA: hypothetical protein [Caudoviricetes sp.]